MLVDSYNSFVPVPFFNTGLLQDHSTADDTANGLAFWHLLSLLENYVPVQYRSVIQSTVVVQKAHNGTYVRLSHPRVANFPIFLMTFEKPLFWFIMYLCQMSYFFLLRTWRSSAVIESTVQKASMKHSIGSTSSSLVYTIQSLERRDWKIRQSSPKMPLNEGRAKNMLVRPGPMLKFYLKACVFSIGVMKAYIFFNEDFNSFKVWW